MKSGWLYSMNTASKTNSASAAASPRRHGRGGVGEGWTMVGSGSHGGAALQWVFAPWPLLSLLGLRRFHARDALPGSELQDLALLGLLLLAAVLTPQWPQPSQLMVLLPLMASSAAALYAAVGTPERGSQNIILSGEAHPANAGTIKSKANNKEKTRRIEHLHRIRFINAAFIRFFTLFFLRPAHQPCPQRIQMDIRADPFRESALLRLDHHRLVPPLKHMPPLLVPGIVSKGIRAQKPCHPLHQIRFRRLQ